MKIEKHIIIFYLVQLIVIFTIDRAFSTENFGGIIVGFLVKTLLFSIISFLLIFLLLGHSIMIFLGVNYQANRNIEFEEILLTSSVIVTTFLLKDMLKIFNLISKDFSFLLIIVLGIPITFLGVYFISLFIAKSLI